MTFAQIKNEVSPLVRAAGGRASAAFPCRDGLSMEAAHLCWAVQTAEGTRCVVSLVW